jgi:hypothetical protein
VEQVLMSDFADIYPLVFTQGRVLERNGRTLTFTLAPAGRVSLPSGRIVACDPLTTSDLEPFVQAVIPGRYIVDLALMREKGKGELVAMARVRFTSKQPAVWVMALRKGEKMSSLGPGGYYGYTSESGTGAFMDATAFETADFAHHDDIDALLVELTGNYQPYRYWMEYPLDRRMNVVMFSSGDGEGRYASYFGIDDGGDVCALVTDFNLLK